MIAVNELHQQKCHNHELLKDLVILITPFCPHIAEELWQELGEKGSVCDAQWITYDEKYLVENEIQLTISFNGKARYQKTFAADADSESIKKAVLSDEKSQKYMSGKDIIKIIVVPKKIVNVVLKN
jgi:leucyl-tRNA synthetase